ncbi:MAG: hypothetical protein LBL13_10130, partial [Bacteroidales bacterium]|nr:hypothetical protein [Bacteroidales bacterium]
DYKFTPGRKEHFAERLKEALSTGWDGFVDFIILLLSAWPLWFILAGIIYLFVRWKQRKK